MDECRRLLVDTKVKDLGCPEQSSLVLLTDKATVGEALQVLAEQRILSAPVVSPESGDEAGVRWPAGVGGADILGFVCVNDILMSFLDCVDGEAANGGAAAPNAAPATVAASAAQGSAGAGAGGARRRSSRASGEGGGLLSRMRELEALGLRFSQRRLRDLTVKGCDGDFLHTRVAGEATLLELVMYGFLDPKRRGMHEGEQQSHVVHRVALFDSSGLVTTVISQTDIVRWLAAHAGGGTLGSLAGATIAQLGWGSKPVASCTPDTPALDAMRLMVQQGVSSLAVVTGPQHHQHYGHAHANTQGAAAAAAGPGAAGAEGSDSVPHVEGRLLGNFSASELRSMTAEHFGALSLPVGEFLAMEHDTEYVAANREELLDEGVLSSPAHSFIANRQLRRARPRSPGEEVGQSLRLVTPETTFTEVVEVLLRHRIHRVYVVDSLERPIGIVTCTDVLRKVVEVATAAAGPGASPVLRRPANQQWGQGPEEGAEGKEAGWR